MSDAPQPTNGNKAVAAMPRCPQCKIDLAGFVEKTIQLPSGMVLHMLYCTNNNCRSLFMAQIIGMAPKSAIAGPNDPVPPFSFRKQ